MAEEHSSHVEPTSSAVMLDLRDCVRNFCAMNCLFDLAFGNNEDDLNKALLQASDD